MTEVVFSCQHDKVELHRDGYVTHMVCNSCQELLEILQTIDELDCLHTHVYFGHTNKFCLDCGLKLRGSFEGEETKETAYSF